MLVFIILHSPDPAPILPSALGMSAPHSGCPSPLQMLALIWIFLWTLGRLSPFSLSSALVTWITSRCPTAPPLARLFIVSQDDPPLLPVFCSFALPSQMFTIYDHPFAPASSIFLLFRMFAPILPVLSCCFYFLTTVSQDIRPHPGLSFAGTHNA